MTSREMLKIRIKDIELEYSVEYRNVKYVRYLLRGAKLKLVVPKRFNENIEDCIHRKDRWLYKKLTEYHEYEKKMDKLTSDKQLVHRSLAELKQLSRVYLDKYQDKLNVRVNRVQFRDTTTKWGSCSSLNNITLSKNLRYLPEHLVAYIIYHELTHIIVLAHNEKFFNIIKKEFPNYKDFDEELNEYTYMLRKYS